MNLITNQTVLMAMFPIIKDQVKRAEQSRLLGESKHEVVVKNVREIYEQTSAPVAFEKMSGMLDGMIDAVVNYYHNTGAFKHSQKIAA